MQNELCCFTTRGLITTKQTKSKPVASAARMSQSTFKNERGGGSKNVGKEQSLATWLRIKKAELIGAMKRWQDFLQ